MATLSYTNAAMFNGQSQFVIKAEKNKAFDDACLIGTFIIEDGHIADCLEHCLENCLCQSFQICENLRCQLCSSNKQENNSLLYSNHSCVYVTYEIQQMETNNQLTVSYKLDVSHELPYMPTSIIR